MTCDIAVSTLDVPGEIRKFLVGETDIVAFRQMYDTKPEINDFLQEIVDRHIAGNIPFLPVPLEYDGRQSESKELQYFFHPESYGGYIYGNAPFGCVRDYLTQEFRMITTNVRTAGGAWTFYDRLYKLFYQYDQTVPQCDEKYRQAYGFMLDVIPQYLEGGSGEMYIEEHIIPLFPETMPKGQRKKAIKAKIKEEFRSEKGYPAWIQSSEWPLGKDGKPATYLGKKKKHNGEMVQYLFRDESDGSTIIVEQFH